MFEWREGWRIEGGGRGGGVEGEQATVTIRNPPPTRPLIHRLHSQLPALWSQPVWVSSLFKLANSRILHNVVVIANPLVIIKTAPDLTKPTPSSRAILLPAAPLAAPPRHSSLRFTSARCYQPVCLSFDATSDKASAFRQQRDSLLSRKFFLRPREVQKSQSRPARLANAIADNGGRGSRNVQAFCDLVDLTCRGNPNSSRDWLFVVFFKYFLERLLLIHCILLIRLRSNGVPVFFNKIGDFVMFNSIYVIL